MQPVGHSKKEGAHLSLQKTGPVFRAGLIIGARCASDLTGVAV